MGIYEDGVARGTQWARQADCDDALRALQVLRSGKSSTEWKQWFTGHDAGQTAFKRFVQVVNPQAHGTPHDIAAFWRSAVEFDGVVSQSALRQGDFVHGFADGALDVWRQAGGAGERGSEFPDEDWLNEQGGPTTENDI